MSKKKCKHFLVSVLVRFFYILLAQKLYYTVNHVFLCCNSNFYSDKLVGHMLDAASSSFSAVKVHKRKLKISLNMSRNLCFSQSILINGL